MYEDFHDGDAYNVNWPLIKSAEKVGNYYTVEQILKAMDFYFRMKPTHDLWDFISEVDRFLSSAEREKELKENLDKLMEQTKNRMKEFM